jgi:hypothetical protein
MLPRRSSSVPPAARDSSAAQRLFARWREGQPVRADDSSVSRTVDGMFAYAAPFGNLARRAEELRLTPLTDQLELLTVPHRNAAGRPVRLEGSGPSTPVPGAKPGCALCGSRDPDLREAAWRSYRITPNAYPYAAPDAQHALLLGSPHQPQRCDAQVLGDMIDFQRLRGPSSTLLHYNGFAGNSQVHLHWHATRTQIPLGRLLEEGQLPLETLRASGSGSVSQYDHGELAGILVRGTPAYVTAEAAPIVARLETEPLTQGRYNLLLLPTASGETRLAIIPRRHGAIEVQAPGMGGAFTACALEVGGRVLWAKQGEPADALAGAREVLHQTVVRPSELSWLS